MPLHDSTVAGHKMPHFHPMQCLAMMTVETSERRYRPRSPKVPIAMSEGFWSNYEFPPLGMQQRPPTLVRCVVRVRSQGGADMSEGRQNSDMFLVSTCRYIYSRG